MAPQELLRLVPGASPALQDILGASSDAVLPPIRAEIFGPQRFAQHGRSLGETHRAERATSHAQTFFPRLRSNIDALRHAHRYIGVQAATGYDISPAAEWLLDNFHLIEAQLKEIHDGLPRRYFRALPVLVDEPLAGLPRIYSVAWAFVAHTDGAFDDDLLVQFLCAYQEARTLNLSELWALPTTLRVVLIENLRRLAERVATNKAAREVANLCCDRIDTCPLEDLDRLLEVLARRGVGPVFLAQMALRLQDRWAGETSDAQARVLAWLQGALPDLAALQTQQRADQAADNLSVSNAVTALRAIGDADWSDIVGRTSALMQRLLASPVFAAEQAITRDQTLHGIELLARRSGRSEVVVADALLDQMRTAASPDQPAAAAGHWLFDAGRPALLAALGLHEQSAQRWRAVARRLALPLYLGVLLAGTVGAIAWLMRRHGVELLSDWRLLGGVLGVVLMLFPVSEAVVAVLHRLISESTRPQHLPRLALAEGIPAEHRAMVVVPGMLTDAASTRALVHRLLLHHLANPERHTQFALLTDWADADTAQCATDAALLDDAVRQVRALNARHPASGTDPTDAPRFLVLHRARLFSPTEQRWIGWERKRGKLEQLVEALVLPASVSASAPGPAAPFLDLGAESSIAPGTRYLVTLDSDTRLPPGRLRELVGVAAHPHNQPRFDATGRAVVAGYGILQPRIVTPLPAPTDVTVYHWLFAGQCGIDPYSAASSEVYQDLFGEGTFTGKGLLNVQAMHAVLAGRLPEGSVLSHDLLEGSMVRCATVTDIALVEDAPFHADVAASRVHRWTRGDWQLLPFLLQPRRYGLRAVNAWKLFDNLRRSLVAPMSLGLLLLSLAGVGVSPWVALGLVLAAFAAGPAMGAVAGFLPGRADLARGYFFSAAARDVVRALGSGLYLLAQLLQQALMAVDAIVRALYRLLVSRRHLLQWTTAAAAQAAASVDLRVVARGHASEPVVALVLFGLLLAAGTPYPVFSAALCLLWAASPLTTWWVSRPRPARADAELPPAERMRLEDIARDTWRLFERVIGPDDRFLPPDNLQTLPHDMVAHRTSPTNIGLYLLSAACARAFGWIGTPELVTRLEATLATLATLERHRGHFLNWYDTQTGAPLLPMYVSTVDSGNLSGHLLAVAQACLALAEAPDPTETPDTLQRLRALAAACEQLAWEADFGFLYHRKRHLLHIGYRVTEQQLDAGFYDLLASESRLTSLLAIAKGDVPVGHWAALGRPFYAVGDHAGLRSWSGSMFEYLMPSLVLDEPHGSVLREACHAALREQIAFAAGQGVPWGISESAYAGRDHTLAYQYAPQGVPRLALRRTPPGELVIAPYATALAALIAPQRAAANFTALEKLGARGPYGFLEALDFSPSRQGDGATFTPVSTFMAHHQGMTIVALANVLLGGVAQRWGMANAHIEAVDSLLHERAPREVPVLVTLPAGPPLQALQRRAPGLLREVVPGVAAVEPTHVLSNGRYNVSLRANGAGWSRWGATGITRWRDDALRDAHGSFFYLRWDRQPTPVSLTQHPAPDPAAHYHSIFHADRVCLDARWTELQAHITVWVSPEDDIEFRQVALHNLSDRTIEVELLSAFDITLSDARADEAHPAFTNLFVRAEWQASQQALVFARQPRLPTEHGLQVAHFLADTDPQTTEVRLQTDRQRWLGRNRAVGDPLAEFDAAPVGTGDERVRLDTGLDPVCAMAVRLRLAPHSVSQLTFATAASDNGGTLHAVIDKYRQPSHVKRASLMSATLTGIRLRALRISPEHFAAVQLLSTALLFSVTRPPTRTVALEDLGVCDRRLLWRFGLSGERPLVLVQIATVQDLGLVRSLAQALRLWSWGEVACDLVVVNAEPASYQMPVQREIHVLRDRHTADSAAERRVAGAPATTLHVLSAEELSPDELSTLKTLARVRFHGDGRPLLHHVQAWSAWHEQALAARQEVSTAVLATSAVPAHVATTVGAFDAASGDFRFPVGAGRRPVRPWLNVLSNPGFGAQLSEAGGGYTWAVNSRMNQLTAWSNDPVADPPSEWFLLQDLRTLQVWSVAPSAWGRSAEDGGEAGGDYRIAHGQGLSVIRHRRGELAVTAAWCVDAVTAVKQVRLHLVNHGARTLHLRVIGLAEWMMGANRSDRSTVHTAQVRQRLPAQRLTALLATQRERAGGFGDGTAFLALAGPDTDGEGEDWTCDRRECFDARGRPVLPDHFGRQQGIGFDPCAALSSRLTLAGGEQGERVFLLGYAESPAAARRIATVAAGQSATQRVDEVRKRWDTLLGTTTVQTPDPLFDAMVNRWLLYQTVSCRLWAKAGFYQAGGATGFRDQLQDAMALAWAAPQMLRDQIVLCASRQFAEGDVQHWWHAPQGAGVRTHFSDDLLWLPHACAHYLRATGDTALLDQPVAFLEGTAIPEGAEDAYYTPTTSDETASVYEHAARSIDHSLRVGVHGLPLMGSGDWNDGMNRVGIEGRGESVWLGWFLCKLVADFAPLARARGDEERAQRWEHAAQGWTLALLGPAWDGQWFKRAFFDDGSALGAQANPEAKIDLIAQAWAVLSKVAPPTWQHLALAAVETHLVDHDAGLIRLLDPPLAEAEPSAGYIQAYPPGVRENGGQYSHAGVWALMAEAQAEHPHQLAPGVASAGDTVYRYFTYLSPAHRAAHPTRGAVYGIEPYAMAGDVYSQPPYVGRGGWSWYTGAAAWLHRAAIESMFGLQLDAQGLCFTPCLPTHWPQAGLTLRREGRVLRFTLVRSTAAQVALAPGERLLRPGERLLWAGLAADSRCVVPLLADGP